MPERLSRHRLPAESPPAGGFSRRRFLASLGALAGAGSLAPLLGGGRSGRLRSVEVTRPGLGSWVRVLARDADPARAERAVERAFAAIARVDAQMSIHRADSQISRVNRAAGRAAVPVDGDVLEVVELACRIAERSGGVYDPTVLPLMRLHGFYGAAAGRLPGDREIGRALAATGWRHVAADRARGTLALSREGAALDLGSIGKGWALDRAVAALRAAGIGSGMVDVGGNVYGIGVPEPGAEGWSVGVLHPVAKRVERVFVLRDAAVATSGNAEQFRILSGVRVGHLFDARRGRPADGHLCASVQAASGVESDALSTAAFLLGPSGTGADVTRRALAVHFVG